jgi:hypothetical protein
MPDEYIWGVFGSHVTPHMGTATWRWRAGLEGCG